MNGAVPPLRRGGHDDTPAPPLHEIWPESPDGIRRPREVYIDLDVPVIVLHLKQRFEGLDAGIGEQDVDTAELSLGQSSGIS